MFPKNPMKPQMAMKPMQPQQPMGAKAPMQPQQPQQAASGGVAKPGANVPKPGQNVAKPGMTLNPLNKPKVPKSMSPMNTLNSFPKTNRVMKPNSVRKMAPDGADMMSRGKTKLKRVKVKLAPKAR